MPATEWLQSLVGQAILLHQDFGSLSSSSFSFDNFLPVLYVLCFAVINVAFADKIFHTHPTQEPH